MDVRFKLGCAVWAYRGWLGDFYPTGSRTNDFLNLYSHRFTTVEGNTTFYAIPDLQTVRRWHLETPDEFEFCLKLPRECTHRGLLQPAIEDSLRFLEHMEGLGDKLGPVFAQLPPTYGPEYLADLEAFLEALPENIPFALEVRHPDWFREPHARQLNAILEGLGVGRVILDTRPIYSGDDDPQANSNRRKPDLPVQPIVTADFTLIRFISHPERSRNERFLREWVNLLEGWLQQGTRVYFFVHCPVEERSPSTARDFWHLLEAQGISLPSLPWDRVEQPPLQLSLF